MSLDGVQRLQPTGIKVVIAGGGVGGLFCALECWRKGHDPNVVERSPEISTLGDFFTITPTGLATLKHYPYMFTKYHQAVYDSTTSLWKPDGTHLKTADPEWRQPGAQTAAPDVKVSFLKTRAFFAEMLYEQTQRLEIPVYFNKKVVAFTEDTHNGSASVETSTGNVYTGDVVVAADGLHSISWKVVTGQEVLAQNSGFAIARVAFHRDVIKPDSLGASLLPADGKRSEFRVYLAPGMHLILFLTADICGFAITHKDVHNAEESWNNHISAEDVISAITEVADWDPAVIDFIKQTPKKVTDWKLNWRDPQQVWTSPAGRIVQLGDAAHAFLPSSGLGATTAIEDTLSFAECLRIGGKDHVPMATKVHNTLRFERTSVLQRVGLANRNQLHHADVEAIAKNPDSFVTKQGRWIWGHNAERYATEMYGEAEDCLRNNVRLMNKNLPPGHVYEPWSLASEAAREAAGLPSTLKENGNWEI